MESISLREKVARGIVFISNTNSYEQIGLSDRKLDIVRGFATGKSFKKLSIEYDVSYNRVKKTVIDFVERVKKIENAEN